MKVVRRGKGEKICTIRIFLVGGSQQNLAKVCFSSSIWICANICSRENPNKKKNFICDDCIPDKRLDPKCIRIISSQLMLCRFRTPFSFPFGPQKPGTLRQDAKDYGSVCGPGSRDHAPQVFFSGGKNVRRCLSIPCVKHTRNIMENILTHQFIREIQWENLYQVKLLSNNMSPFIFKLFQDIFREYMSQRKTRNRPIEASNQSAGEWKYFRDSGGDKY